MADTKEVSPHVQATPPDGETILAREVDWTVQEETKAKRK